MFFNLIDLDLETSTGLQKSDVGPLVIRLPELPLPQSRWVPPDSQPTPYQGGPVIAMQHQDEVCDSQHPCMGGGVEV